MRIPHPSWFNASHITRITKNRRVSFRLGGNIPSAKGSRFSGVARACSSGKILKLRNAFKIDNCKKNGHQFMHHKGKTTLFWVE